MTTSTPPDDLAGPDLATWHEDRASHLLTGAAKADAAIADTFDPAMGQALRGASLAGVAAAQAHATLAVAIRMAEPEPTLAMAESPCGSFRVVEYDHGEEAVARWCDRTAGPCPYPGAKAAAITATAHPCAALSEAQAP